MRICPTVRNSALLPANGTNGTTITTCTREVENNNQVSETPPLFQSPLPPVSCLHDQHASWKPFPACCWENQLCPRYYWSPTQAGLKIDCGTLSIQVGLSITVPCLLRLAPGSAFSQMVLNLLSLTLLLLGLVWEWTLSTPVSTRSTQAGLSWTFSQIHLSPLRRAWVSTFSNITVKSLRQAWAFTFSQVVLNLPDSIESFSQTAFTLPDRIQSTRASLRTDFSPTVLTPLRLDSESTISEAALRPENQLSPWWSLVHSGRPYSPRQYLPHSGWPENQLSPSGYLPHTGWPENQLSPSGYLPHTGWPENQLSPRLYLIQSGWPESQLPDCTYLTQAGLRINSLRDCTYFTQNQLSPRQYLLHSESTFSQTVLPSIRLAWDSTFSQTVVLPSLRLAWESTLSETGLTSLRINFLPDSIYFTQNQLSPWQYLLHSESTFSQTVFTSLRISFLPDRASFNQAGLTQLSPRQ